MDATGSVLPPPTTKLDKNDDQELTCCGLYVLKTTAPWISMSQQGADSLNRTFTELKSKDEDRRRLAAYDLYQFVSTAYRGEVVRVLPTSKLTDHRAISG